MHVASGRLDGRTHAALVGASPGRRPARRRDRRRQHRGAAAQRAAPRCARPGGPGRARRQRGRPRRGHRRPAPAAQRGAGHARDGQRAAHDRRARPAAGAPGDPRGVHPARHRRQAPVPVAAVRGDGAGRDPGRGAGRRRAARRVGRRRGRRRRRRCDDRRVLGPDARSGGGRAAPRGGRAALAQPNGRGRPGAALERTRHRRRRRGRATGRRGRGRHPGRRGRPACGRPVVAARRRAGVGRGRAAGRARGHRGPAPARAAAAVRRGAHPGQGPAPGAAGRRVGRRAAARGTGRRPDGPASRASPTTPAAGGCQSGPLWRSTAGTSWRRPGCSPPTTPRPLRVSPPARSSRCPSRRPHRSRRVAAMAARKPPSGTPAGQDALDRPRIVHPTVPPTATEIAEAVRAGTLSPRDTVAASIRAIVAHDGRLGAFQVVRARAVADEAAELAARSDLGSLPLAGVPVAVKDNVAVAGEPMPARVGRHLRRRRARATTPSCSGCARPGRWSSASPAMPELGVFGATDSSFGITHNPWDRSRTPGGSSGGGGRRGGRRSRPGGARQRRAWARSGSRPRAAGVYGIKPGHGVVPAGVGGNDSYDMVENGPLATTVRDAALLLSVMADDPSLADVAEPEHPLRIAVSAAPAAHRRARRPRAPARGRAHRARPRGRRATSSAGSTRRTRRTRCPSSRGGSAAPRTTRRGWTAPCSTRPCARTCASATRCAGAGSSGTPTGRRAARRWPSSSRRTTCC